MFGSWGRQHLPEPTKNGSFPPNLQPFVNSGIPLFPTPSYIYIYILETRRNPCPRSPVEMWPGVFHQGSWHWVPGHTQCWAAHFDLETASPREVRPSTHVVFPWGRNFHVRFRIALQIAVVRYRSGFLLGITKWWYSGLSCGIEAPEKWRFVSHLHARMCVTCGTRICCLVQLSMNPCLHSCTPEYNKLHSSNACITLVLQAVHCVWRWHYIDATKHGTHHICAHYLHT